jgi:uncharacterized protein
MTIGKIRAAGKCLLVLIGFSFALSTPAGAQSGGYSIGQKPPPASQAGLPGKAGVRELAWEDLVPKDWNPRRLLDELGLDRLQDGDPRADAILERIREEWNRAPVVGALDGQKVRLPGFVVMLEGDARGVSEFLLVPYFGACIHVPPPPSNQLVHVFPAKRVPEDMAVHPVWVVGTVQTVQADTRLGSAGYRIKNAHIEPYRARNP